MKQNISFFVFVVLVGTIAQISAEIITPSLPFISRDFIVDDSLVQLTVSYYILGMAIPAIVFGVLGDIWGRRTILLISAVIGMCGTIMCIAAPNIYLVIIGRVIQGTGFGGVFGMGYTLIMDKYKGIELAKYMSILNIAISLSIDLAPFIGGFLQAFVSWRMIFLLVLLHNLAVLYLSYKYKEIYTGHTVDVSIKKLWIKLINIIVDKNFILYSVLSGLIYSIFMSYIVVSTFIVQDLLHKSSIYYGVLTICLSLIFAASSFTNGRMLNKFSIESLTKFGFLLCTVSGIILLLLSFFTIDASQYIFALLFMFIGSGFIFSNTNSLAFSTITTDIGMASAIMTTIKMLLAFFITWSVGIFSTSSTFALGISITLLSSMSLVLLYGFFV